MSRVTSPRIQRLLYWTLVGLAVAGASALYAQSQGLVTVPNPRISAPALLSSSAPAEAHYAPDENLEPIDVALIDEASETIDMAAYVLTDVPIIEALTDAAARGVKIRLFRFPSSYAEDGRIGEALAALTRAPGVTERFKKGADLMHLKSYCVDGATLRAGAANFSASGLKRQINDLFIFRGAHACDKFERAFAAMWSE